MVEWIKSDLSKTQIIFLGACILSYTHTLNLFERSGYPGILAHIGTVICELMFFLGVKSEHSHAGTRFALGFGGLIILYSNVSFGLANGKALVFYEFSNGMAINEVILCGGLIPCLVWVSEWVGTKVKAYKQNESLTSEDVSHTNSHESNMREDENLTNNHENYVSGIESHTSPHKPHVKENENPTATQMIEEDLTKSDNESHKDQTTTQTEEINTNESHETTQELTEEEKEKRLYEGMSIEEIIHAYEERNGKLPTISKLEFLANVSNWTARQALRPYRQKVRDVS